MLGIKMIKKFSLIFCFLGVTILFFNCCFNKTNNNPAEEGNTYFVSKNYAKAQKAYELALAQGYKTFDIYSNLGSIYYYELKDYVKAEKILKEGIKYYPKIDILHSMFSQLYFETGNLELGVKEYKTAVTLGKYRIITINMNEAKKLLKAKGKTDQGIYDFFINITKFNPNDYYAIYELALYDKKQHRYKEALEKFNKVIDLSKNMRTAVLVDVGICYYELGDYRQAAKVLKEAQSNGDFVPPKILEDIEANLEER